MKLDLTALRSAIVSLAEDFGASSLPLRVDVVDRATTAAALRAIISRGAVTPQDGETIE